MEDSHLSGRRRCPSSWPEEGPRVPWNSKPGGKGGVSLSSPWVVWSRWRHQQSFISDIKSLGGSRQGGTNTLVQQTGVPAHVAPQTPQISSFKTPSNERIRLNYTPQTHAAAATSDSSATPELQVTRLKLSLTTFGHYWTLWSTWGESRVCCC